MRLKKLLPDYVEPEITSEDKETQKLRTRQQQSLLLHEKRHRSSNPSIKIDGNTSNNSPSISNQYDNSPSLTPSDGMSKSSLSQENIP